MAASSFFCFLGFRVKVASFLKLVPFVESFFGNCLVEVLATGGYFSNYSPLSSFGPSSVVCSGSGCSLVFILLITIVDCLRCLKLILF